MEVEFRRPASPSLASASRPAVLSKIQSQWRRVRGTPAFHPTAFRERVREWFGGHPVAEDRLHAEAALDWLARAQDATRSGGFARGYSLTSTSHLGGPGWQPAYPETTGYIIPSLYLAAEALARPELRDRAQQAAEWEITVQMPSGAVPAGVLGESDAPAVFNTGQVLIGYVSAYHETHDELFATAARRAGTWLVDSQGADGLWHHGNSPLAASKSTLYNARVGWALSEAGAILGEPAMTRAASRNLRRVASLQHANGWLPRCCLSDPTQPLLHTLAYAIRGLLEGGRVLGESEVLEAAVRGAEALAERVGANGWMAGRFTEDWQGAVGWSCLTGEAQMANVWLRLYQITGEARWLEQVGSVLAFLKRTQNRGSAEPGLRGGIKGSYPIGGRYGRYEVLNWATKFFFDALVRRELLTAGHHWDSLRYVLP